MVNLDNLNLTGNRIILKKFTIREINKKYMDWFSGKNSHLKYSQHNKKKYNRNTLLKYCVQFDNSRNFFLAIFDLKKKLIGTITVYIDKKKIGNLGILIGDKNYLSKGYALESISLIIRYLFRKKTVNSIIMDTKKENLKMINLMKNLNMKKIGSQKPYSISYKIFNFL